MRELPIARTARLRFDLERVMGPAGIPGSPRDGSERGGQVGAVGAGGAVADLALARRIAARLNAVRPPGTPSAQAGELAALGLLHEIFHLVVDRATELDASAGMEPSAGTTAASLGPDAFRRLLDELAGEFPDVAPRLEPDRLEELLLIRIANENPAVGPLRDLIDDRPLPAAERGEAIAALEQHHAGRVPLGPNGETLVELLRAPARAHPTSLAGQLRYIRDHWRGLLGDALDALLDRLLVTLDVIAEEERGLHLRFGGAGGVTSEADVTDFGALGDEPERFSSDSAWMPRLVLIAKSTYVWLDQLSRWHRREIRTLDAIPDEELDRLARLGITGLWLIGLWERSRASQRIKAWRGNPDAAASAYSLDDYRIARDLGGDAAWADLRHRAWQRGIRLASDMVPNHMGIDSSWVIEHPEWFLSLPEPPYPGYRFEGDNLADDERVEIRLEDHYWDNSDAAVVFERRDRHTGERRYVYHGNDGTSFPWNDTAQLDFSSAAVREQVIRTILEVARRFPVIRFDAAMVLAKRHIRRLWFPAPGEGGAIPSRAEHGSMSHAEFERRMPVEFWREVVDRVAAEVPDTLLLAEAFWMLEGYFVRTLGMHRVYNSAFMHMLRDEDNDKYRKLIRDTLEFDPEILKRYVNFMNNPDEKTAVEQFGKGDKYFGIATVMATMPGLPMFGHGQFEGFSEKYGMEFRRASMDEAVDPWLVARHEREIVPLLHRRGDFAEVRDFLLYDVVGDGGVIEDILAYSNGWGPTRSLVVCHNRYAAAAGWLRESVAFAVKEAEGSKRLERRTLATGLGLPDGDDWWLAFREQRSGLQYLRPVAELRERGLFVSLGAYETQVLWDMRDIHDPTGIWRRLAERLGGAGVPSLEEALRELQLAPVHDAVAAAVREPDRERIETALRAIAEATGTMGDLGAIGAGIAERLARVEEVAPELARVEEVAPELARVEEVAPELARVAGEPPVAPEEPADASAREVRSTLLVWAAVASIGALAPGAPVGATSRAWYDELRLAPIIARALRERGLDEGAAWGVAERVRMLLDLPVPATIGGPAATAAQRLLEAWLFHPDVRRFIRVNTFEGVEWFHGESFDELVAWMERLDRVLTPPGERGRAPVARDAVGRALREAAAASDYRVDRLREALAGGAAGARPGRRGSRTVKASLPPGPRRKG